MKSRIRSIIRFIGGADHRLILTVSWSFGLLFGIFFSSIHEESVTSLLRGGIYTPVSAFGLVVVLILPFALSYLAIRFNLLAAVFFLAFLKAFSFGFCSFGIACTFSQGGWLLRFLLLFSGSCTLPLLLLFWLRNLSGSRSQLTKDALIYSAAALFVGLMDMLLISPILSSFC